VLPLFSIICRHARSHFKHSSAHDFIRLSFANFSHSFAHEEQISAHATRIAFENGPFLATICAAAEQTVAQSRQSITVDRCSFWPSCNILVQ
jgi:hypothetical protein